MHKQMREQWTKVVTGGKMVRYGIGELSADDTLLVHENEMNSFP